MQKRNLKNLTQVLSLELSEPDSEEEPVAPRPPRVTVLNIIQAQDVVSESGSSSLLDIDLWEAILDQIL